MDFVTQTSRNILYNINLKINPMKNSLEMRFLRENNTRKKLQQKEGRKGMFRIALDMLDVLILVTLVL